MDDFISESIIPESRPQKINHKPVLLISEPSPFCWKLPVEKDICQVFKASEPVSHPHLPHSFLVRVSDPDVSH